MATRMGKEAIEYWEKRTAYKKGIKHALFAVVIVAVVFGSAIYYTS